jgi:putrescine transport system ATP-binding protein
MNKKSFIEIKNVSKQFNQSNILNDVNLIIHEGEIFSILGTSGCGKSTLLRIIAGFEEPDSGEIIIDGENILNLPAYKRPVNMMFQNYALFPHMNLYNNIAFGLRQEKLPFHIIDDRVKESLDMVGMSELKDRYPNQISGGQQQRIALARSIVKRPKLLLLDEPLGSLDRKTRERTQMELIKIQDFLNLTFILVTHDQDEAMSLSDRIGVMKAGEVLQIGKPERIYENPNSIFVANFVGSINIFSGAVIASDGINTSVYIDEIGKEIKISSDEIYLREQKIWIGYRPEELTLSDQCPEQQYNVLQGEIMDIGFLGSEIFYHVQLHNEQIIHISMPTAARSKNINFIIGNAVYITWHSSDGVIMVQ